MKIISIEYCADTQKNIEGNLDIILKADTALLTDDRHRFFIPDYTMDVRCSLARVIKINKMGKNIAEKFASRYYEEISIGLNFTAFDMLNKLKGKDKAWSLSKTFDNSTVLAPFINKKSLENRNNLVYSFNVNGKEIEQKEYTNLNPSNDAVISYVSRFFTLKTGDILLISESTELLPLKIGDKLELYLDGKKVQDIHVC